MILAAGLSPAWQQILVLDGLRSGEVNRAREVHWCASGKVLNVGLALHHLGGRSLTLALAGGAAGEEIERELAALGVAARFVRSRNGTRVCTTILDRTTGLTTELVENSRPVEAGEVEEFQRVYAEAVSRADAVVLSGSLPPGVPATLYRDLAALSRGPVILDARGPELLAALPLGPLCAKPNREELARTCGRELATDVELRGAMGELNRRGAQWVVTSHGKGELWATSEGTLHRFLPARVETVNPIGCGDCLAAGIAWAVARGEEMLDAIRFGMAAAAENAAMLLPARLELERVRRRMEEVSRVG